MKNNVTLSNQHLSHLSGNFGQWLTGHHVAVADPNAIELPFIHIVQFLHDFRISHTEQYGSDAQLADDSYSGDPWLEILRATRMLLSTELGRLDGGILDAYILEELRDAGFTEDNL